ncbi:MAG: Gldg family protein [Verrucomicrobia bacterium]|nr:Gldg family protein [Verrucomicrobiota bacterium]
MAHKPTHPVTRAAFGIGALVAIAILANWLISISTFGNRGQDFTENKVHTLSKGTRAILGELDTPVVIRYYASRNTAYMPEQLKLHMRRVDDLLKEYASLSKGKLRIDELDPQPDTDAEDSANLDGINGQRMDDQNLYFGLAVSCVDRTSVIPFLDPNDETMLEYHLSKAVAEVSTPAKPVIGVMSALSLAGSPAMMQGQRPTQPWVFYQQLKQAFEVKDLGMTPATINPKEIKVLLLFHPAGITPEAEFAVDQYLLGGGTVVACLDAFSIAAQMTGGGNPMMGGGGAPTTSTLPTLLAAWGMTFESTQCLADPTYMTPMRTRTGSADAVAVLTLPQKAMPQKDNVITKDLESIMMLLPGAFTNIGGAKVAADTLVRSSLQAGFVDSMRASQLDPALATSLKAKGTAYDLITHLTGTFQTAFPNGKPGEAPAAPKVEEPKKEIGQLPAEVKKEEPKPEWLKVGTSEGNVFLIADIDAFYDQFAYRVQNFGGMQMASPSNGNSSLFFNLLDQATGSKHLIGSRSRAAVRRPFTVIQEMEANFNKQSGEEIANYETKQKEVQQKLSDLQAQKAKGSELHLSPEQEAEIRKLRQDKVDTSRLIREKEKELRRQKDKLSGNITLLNVAVMPSIVILFGFAFLIKRRSATRAR